MLIILFVLVSSLFLERLLKFYGPQTPIMWAVPSFAILSVALYIILSHAYSSQDRNWAYVSVGIALGLWLKIQDSSLLLKFRPTAPPVVHNLLVLLPG